MKKNSANVYVGSKYYTMVNGTLINGEVLEVAFDGHGDYTTEFMTSIGEVVTLPSSAIFYNTEEDFKSNNQRTDGVDFVYDGCDEDTDTCWNVRWAMVDGEPKKLLLTIKSLVVRRGKLIITYMDDNYNEDNTYGSRDECLDNNEYIYTDENGIEHHRVGFAKLTRLTDEQRELVEKFKQMAEELKKNGVAIIINHEDSGIGFYNRSELTTSSGYYWDCDDAEELHKDEDRPSVEWNYYIHSDARWGDSYFCYTLKSEKKTEE